MPVEYPTLSEKACQEFFAEPHVAILSIPNGSRAPLSHPTAYGYEPGGDVRIFAHEDSFKVKLMRDGVKVSFTVDTVEPTRWVRVEGTVVASEKGDLDRDFRAIIARYHADPADLDEGVETYRAAGDEMLVLTIRPDRFDSSDLSGKPKM